MKMKENDQVFLVPEGEIKKDRDYNLITLCSIVAVLVIVGFINLYRNICPTLDILIQDKAIIQGI